MTPLDTLVCHISDGPEGLYIHILKFELRMIQYKVYDITGNDSIRLIFAPSNFDKNIF